MSVPYEAFVNPFLLKVRDYEIPRMVESDAETVVFGYMHTACAQFAKMSQHKLTVYDDEKQEIDAEIKPEDIDEIADIVSDGMVVQWLKKYLYNAENLENVLNTTDFKMYSPAELLYRLHSAYDDALQRFTYKMREYTYAHGDLSELHL